jgi:7,8-dihydropterin-6-yl-methyl-4-(beta-D-ribofuranosyl)aminobenzene 5'-phosphate synthase
LLADGRLLYLGEIPRETTFETPHPAALYDDGRGTSHRDALEDDSGVAANVRGRGLVVISGCAHAGIVNTVQHARRLTGVDEVLAIIGGFHLNGPLFEPRIEETIDALIRLDPTHVIPTHCTGRHALTRFEQRMPTQFRHNLVGTLCKWQTKRGTGSG